MRNTLLTRDEFRESVQERDNHRCVFCGRGLPEVKLDSHHIMERRLWIAPHEFGGYFRDNGATCCDTGYDKTDKGKSILGRPQIDWSCHLLCGMTLIHPDQVREAAGITNLILPEHLYPDILYTVWGDGIISDDRRIRGELFQDESVQHMLKMGGVLERYIKYIRHYRTFHLPYSPIVAAIKADPNLRKKWDDKVMHDDSYLKGQEVVVTAKMDGGQCLDENTLITTPDGDLTIRQICESDGICEVLSYNHDTNVQEFQPVMEKIILPESDDWYEIELDDGKKLVLTGNDRVWLEDLQCYRLVRDLSGGENILLKK